MMISIITPIYNGKEYIKDCIETVAQQKCSSIEHIIVDGGSTDGTLEFLEKYCKEYPHISWISKKDRGQSDAMNNGISMAQGDIISILNVDDFYAENTLNRVLEIFEDLPDPSFLVGNCNILNDKGHITAVNRPSRLKVKELLLGFRVNPHPVNPSAYFYHKSLHKEVGPYLVDEHYIMDLWFIFEAVQKSKVKYVDEVFGNYRYLIGTKSQVDASKGAGTKRQENLYNYYYDQLPFNQKFEVTLKRFYYKTKFSYGRKSLTRHFKNMINKTTKFSVFGERVE